LLRKEIKLTIRPVRVHEAKDFLVQQTAEQALLEGVPLSDLQKRMMYFTEGKEATEDPIELNDEFEAQHNTAEYEAKISRLLHHAYSRVKKENPETARVWDESIRLLRKGDHYILVLWDQSPERPPYDFLRLAGASILLCAVIFGFIVLAVHYHWTTGPKTHGSAPVWIQRLLLAATVGAYVYSVILPRVLKKVPTWMAKDKLER
jgi:hypothetical protein